jgi:hypothetical protein
VARTAPTGNNGTPASEKSFLYDKQTLRLSRSSRDFVPWRFSDAGQLNLPSVSSLPASKNQHRNRHRMALIYRTASSRT